MTTAFKTCTCCKELKTVDSFAKNKRAKDNLYIYCRSCKSRHDRQYKDLNRDKINQKRRLYSKSESGRTKRRDANYREKFGITIEEYNTLLVLQDNKCAICYNEETVKNRALAVDHCHETSKVRGLLCMNCNIALGKFQDNLSFLNNAIGYLKKHG